MITAEEWRSLPVDTATATDPFAAAPRTWALRWTVSERADHAQWEAWADSAGRLTLGQRCHREVTARGVRPTWNGMRWSARAVER